MKESEKIFLKKAKKEKFNWRILGENFVFENEGHFYKMPAFVGKNLIYKNTDTYEEILKNVEIINNYFGPLCNIAETEIEKDPETGDYIIKQKKVPGQKLTKEIMNQNPRIEAKFKKFVIANEIMWRKEGYFLDLVGSEIVTQPGTIHNMYTDGENIYIFDFGLLKRKANSRIYSLFSKFGTWFQLLIFRIFYR